MESAGGKRLRAGNGVEAVAASNGAGIEGLGGERKRRRNRFAESQADSAPPGPSASDDLADLARIVAGAKAAAESAKAAKAAKEAQERAAAAGVGMPPALVAPSMGNGAVLRPSAGRPGDPSAAALAAAAAAATARVNALAGSAGALGAVAPPVMAQSSDAVTAAAQAASTKAATMARLEAQIRASLSNVNSVALAGAGMGGLSAAGEGSSTASVASKKAQDHTLRLDEHGRQVDADGKVVKAGPVLTLKANRLGGMAQNPYLQHKAVEDADASQVIDPRVKTGSRDKRAKRAFNFVEEGTYVKQGDNLRFREHRKLLSGRMSGRNRAEQLDAANHVELPDKADFEPGEPEKVVDEGAKKADTSVPPLRSTLEEDAPAVEMEWWDEAFLTKESREEKAQGTLLEGDEDKEILYELLDLENAKTYRYVQHPKKPGEESGSGEAAARAGAGGGAGAKSTSGDGGDEGGEGGGSEAAMKVYLTKKERKRIRHKARMEREREKQDKIALGLIPAPEPKLKIANFMQVLGDQAIVDPSKVEALVMGQVARRKAEHEARNQAAKLTPQERREKKKKKLLEDTSRELQVAVFRVADMSDPKKRFKVDVNAQQRYLSGAVIMCTDTDTPGMNMVVVEGGPKAVRAYVKLMTRRIRWEEEEFGGGDSESDSDDEDAKPALSGSMCELVWQGAVQSRAFSAFRFQECKSPETARRVLEEKGVAHLWDMVVASAKIARESASKGPDLTGY